MDNVKAKSPKPARGSLRDRLIRARKTRKRLNAGQEYAGWAHFIPLAPIFP